MLVLHQASQLPFKALGVHFPRLVMTYRAQELFYVHDKNILQQAFSVFIDFVS